jgi:20S proteasome alpha/beta subunit
MITKKNKKQIHQYEEDFFLAIQGLTDDINRYLKVAESEYVSHNDIVRTIHLINWTARTVAENKDELEIKILAAE